MEVHARHEGSLRGVCLCVCVVEGVGERGVCVCVCVEGVICVHV